jgi:hypothetical protein
MVKRSRGSLGLVEVDCNIMAGQVKVRTWQLVLLLNNEEGSDVQCKLLCIRKVVWLGVYVLDVS